MIHTLQRRNRSRPRRFWTVVLIGLAVPVLSHGDTNIDPMATGNKYGWSTADRWLNLQGDLTSGVVVTPDYLYGYAWWQDFGWVHFGDGSPDNGIHYGNDAPTDYGVNNDGRGQLSGFAWSESCGWINFDTLASGGSRVRISPVSGGFSGYAWCEAGIWIGFTGFVDYAAATDPQNVIRRNPARHWPLYK